MPTTEELLAQMRAAQATGDELARSMPDTLGDPDLTPEGATEALNSAVKYLAMVDRFYDAVEIASEDREIDLATEEQATEYADSALSLGLTLIKDAFERLRSLGADANQALADAQDKYGERDDG